MTGSGYTLHEAIVLARDTYKQIGSPPPVVRMPAVFAYVEKVEEQRSGKPHKIEVWEADVTRSEYRGLLVRGGKEQHVTKIFVCKELNFCWRRFVMCKEAMHLLVDETDRFATTMQDQTEEAFDLYWPKKSDADLSSEVFAAVVAFELLYPFGARGRVASPPLPLRDQAEKFKIPERYLDSYYKFPYGKLSEGINDGLIP
jgi:hypothetical protein